MKKSNISFNFDNQIKMMHIHLANNTLSFYLHLLSDDALYYTMGIVMCDDLIGDRAKIYMALKEEIEYRENDNQKLNNNNDNYVVKNYSELNHFNEELYAIKTLDMMSVQLKNGSLAEYLKLLSDETLNHALIEINNDNIVGDRIRISVAILNEIKNREIKRNEKNYYDQVEKVSKCR